MNTPIDITNMNDLEVKELMESQLQRIINHIINNNNDPPLPETQKERHPESDTPNLRTEEKQ